MKTWILNLGMASALLGTLAVACGTDTVDGAVPGEDAGDSGTTPPDSGANPPSAPEYVVSGTVTGLLGTGMVLQDNGGDDLTVNANGTFVFAKKVAAGAPYAVSIKTQPTAPSQSCTVSGGTGTVGASNVTSVVINCSALSYTVGGTISGLAGSGLVLQNNAGDDLIVGAFGTFAFPTALAEGADYAVTVKTQPTNLSQTCTVTNGSGKIGTSKVTNVAVNCVTNKFTVGGTVTGLVGSGLILQNNAGEALPVTADGKFTFTSAQADGTNFDVTTLINPTNPQQVCTVSGGTGTLAGGNVTTVTVNCATDAFTIGGSISGLAGTGLVLQNNGGDDITPSANGTFAFPKPVADLAAYAVTVKTQPTNKWQTCSVSNGSGTVASTPVTDVAVTCTTNSYKVKASVAGLSGSGLVLQNNAGDDLTISADGTFEFATPVASGDGYVVSVLTNPANKSQTCTVTSGTGTMAGADVDVAVSCTTNTYTIGGNVIGLAVGNSVVLQNNAGDDISVGADGPFTFATQIESGQTYAVTVKTNPTTPNQTCIVTGDTGSVAAGNVVSVNVNCTTNTYTAGGVVTGLDGTGLVLQNNAGDDLPINANGSFAFHPQADGSGYDVSIKTQPTAKSQTCTVTNGTGALAGGNVNSVGVACTTNKFSVGGSVTGLAGGTVVLTNNGGDDKTLGADGAFTFGTQIASGSAYAVAVKTQPVGKYCSVTNGAGTVTNAAIGDVSVTCIAPAFLATVAGTTFFSVPVTGLMTDANIYAACTAFGLVPPCHGPSGCAYQDNKCKLVAAADAACLYPGRTLANAMCGGADANACAPLYDTFYYLGGKWTSGGACGMGPGWCTNGSGISNKKALCVAP